MKHPLHHVALLIPFMLLTGCTAPSVLPLLDLTHKALLDEQQQVQAAGQRETNWLDQSRASLDQGFAEDLKAAKTLSVEWVRQETAGYVAAREALLTHQQQLAQARANRIDNLKAADEALTQARTLLQQRDALIEQISAKFKVQSAK